MNPDNPYAAPQTIEPQLAADEQLPVATLTGRQRYPEMDTATLLQLAKWSRSLEAATVLWMFPLLGSLGPAFLMILIGKSNWLMSGLSIIFLGLCLVRLYIGSARQSAHRLVIRGADVLFLAVLVGTAGWCLALFWQAPFLNMFFLIVLGLLALLLTDSIRATFSAPKLFGPTPFVHRELVEEADYRRAHGIV